jgi:protein-S-isoprenylcysteine O-methyltransferase Ste14
MNTWTGHLIIYGWAAWGLYWLIMAFTAKRTVERRGAVVDRLVVAGVVVAWVVIKPFDGTHAQLWVTHVGLGVVSDCIFIVGAAFTVWARVTLGRNWSAEVAFKQDHELIQTGPYAIVRHPIYTGMLGMALGTAIDYGRASGFVVFALLCVGAWLKSRQEERLMADHFPDAYRHYKDRVHALIPFVL